MGKVQLTVVAAMATAVLLGASPPARGATDDQQLRGLRDRLAAISQQLHQAEGRLADLMHRPDLAAFAAQLESLDDGSYAEAVDLGIVDRIAAAETGLTPDVERRVAAAIVRESRAAGLDPLLITGLIEVESSFRNFAISNVGAVGLMQVMPATGRWFGKKIGLPYSSRQDLLDPVHNIRLGVQYLAELKRRFGRIDHALLAYNTGPGRAKQILRSPAERRSYLATYPRKVLDAQRRLQAELATR